MSIPIDKAPLFSVTEGLPAELGGEKVVFEKYVQTRIGNAEANRIYANGDFYKVYLGSSQHLKKDDIKWEKVGVISEKGLKKLSQISKDEVQDFIADGPHKVVTQAVENNYWYFYFDSDIYVHSQLRQWKRSPKFTRRIGKAIERNFTPNS